MCLQDFELFRVFDSLAFEDDDIDTTITGIKAEADMDPDSTQAMLKLSSKSLNSCMLYCQPQILNLADVS